jgi:hypothetical protein
VGYKTSSLLIPCVAETAHLSISTERIWPSDSEEKSEGASLFISYVLSRPGVFAYGDVRANRVKRVASAAGEGSMAVQFIHEILKTYPLEGDL